MSTPQLKAQDSEGMGGLQLAMLLGLFFLSGAAALIYEVLWLKELGRLFGVTAHAAATTLAVFFLGLAAGGWVWGTRSARARNPLRTYGLLELANRIGNRFSKFPLRTTFSGAWRRPS